MKGFSVKHIMSFPIPRKFEVFVRFSVHTLYVVYDYEYDHEDNKLYIVW